MDIDHETWKLKVGLAIIVLFIVSAFVSCNELHYATRAKTTEATVDNVFDSTTRRGGIQRVVKYHFHDDSGRLRNATDTVDPSFPRDIEKVQIEYLADTSRLAGHRNVLALTIFFGSLVAMVVGLTMFILHVRRETRPRAQAASSRSSARYTARR